MSKHMTIINLACTITKLRKWGEAWKHSAESAQAATARMHQAHEAKMVEHRAAFGARTEADAKIIAGLRAEIDSLKREELATNETLKPLVDRVVTERDGLLTQVQDQRAEIERLQWENMTMHKDAEDGYTEAIKVLGDPIALSKERDALRAEVAALQERLRASIARGDFAQMEVAALKSQTPKHPWTFANCEPCDQPATHDTDAGKAAAESAVKTEPVTDEIMVGDVVEVVSNTGRNTWLADVGSVGTVVTVEEINDSISVHLEDVPGKKNALAGYVSFCDVRKVPQ